MSGNNNDNLFFYVDRHDDDDDVAMVHDDLDDVLPELEFADVVNEMMQDFADVGPPAPAARPAANVQVADGMGAVLVDLENLGGGGGEGNRGGADAIQAVNVANPEANGGQDAAADNAAAAAANAAANNLLMNPLMVAVNNASSIALASGGLELHQMVSDVLELHDLRLESQAVRRVAQYWMQHDDPPQIENFSAEFKIELLSSAATYLRGSWLASWLTEQGGLMALSQRLKNRDTFQRVLARTFSQAEGYSDFFEVRESLNNIMNDYYAALTRARNLEMDVGSLGLYGKFPQFSTHPQNYQPCLLTAYFRLLSGDTTGHGCWLVDKAFGLPFPLPRDLRATMTYPKLKRPFGQLCKASEAKEKEWRRDMLGVRPNRREEFLGLQRCPPVDQTDSDVLSHAETLRRSTADVQFLAALTAAVKCAMAGRWQVTVFLLGWIIGNQLLPILSMSGGFGTAHVSLGVGRRILELRTDVYCWLARALAAFHVKPAIALTILEASKSRSDKLHQHIARAVAMAQICLRYGWYSQVEKIWAKWNRSGMIPSASDHFDRLIESVCSAFQMDIEERLVESIITLKMHFNCLLACDQAYRFAHLAAIKRQLDLWQETMRRIATNIHLTPEMSATLNRFEAYAIVLNLCLEMQQDSLAAGLITYDQLDSIRMARLKFRLSVHLDQDELLQECLGTLCRLAAVDPLQWQKHVSDFCAFDKLDEASDCADSLATGDMLYTLVVFVFAIVDDYCLIPDRMRLLNKTVKCYQEATLGRHPRIEMLNKLLCIESGIETPLPLGLDNPLLPHPGYSFAMCSVTGHHQHQHWLSMIEAGSGQLPLPYNFENTPFNNDTLLPFLRQQEPVYFPLIVQFGQASLRHTPKI